MTYDPEEGRISTPGVQMPPPERGIPCKSKSLWIYITYNVFVITKKEKEKSSNLQYNSFKSNKIHVM